MITVPSTPAQVLFTPPDERGRFLPEGPRIVRFLGRDWLAWVNIQTASDSLTGEIHLLDRATDEHRAFPLPGRPGFLMPTDREGVLLVGCDKTVGTFDLATTEFTALATIPDDSPRTIINDGEIVPGGEAIVFGTKDTQFADKIAKIYLFTVGDNQISVLRSQQICSNGKVFTTTRDGIVMYDIDTPTQEVREFRLDVGKRTLMPMGMVIDLRSIDGFPDGMVDSGDGTLLIAFYNPAEITDGTAIRFELLTGQPIERFDTPGSPRVTCPLLLRNPTGEIELILTTCDEGMPEANRALAPNRGCLFTAPTTLTTIPKPKIVRLPTV